MKILNYIWIILIFVSCKKEVSNLENNKNSYLLFSKDILDYKISPKSVKDKKGLMFSDQGAWFAYSFPDTNVNYGGFSGPFLMTQDNGVWLSPTSFQIQLKEDQGQNIEFTQPKSSSYNSHLQQEYTLDQIKLKQTLVFHSGHSARINSEIKNTSNQPISLNITFKGQISFLEGLSYTSNGNQLTISSERTDVIGHFILPLEIENLDNTNGSYQTKQVQINLEPNEIKSFETVQSFIFPEYPWKKELTSLKSSNFKEVLTLRKEEKEKELKDLVEQLNPKYQEDIYKQVLAKSHLTLQNNWRLPSGEIKHEGLFPSYHYKWFHGFWSWDSWKHAVGLSYYNTDLAKKQMKLMFEFQNEDGFVADCVYRDNRIEEHNYRDTKPPLSAWAVAKIHEKDDDIEFVKYMYPKIKKYHEWWYLKRDHDQDGLCEYGSTDGSLVAAKWESGMDNAIRFDQSKILQNSEGAYSLNQESVDLNAYLFAEKLYLSTLAQTLQLEEDALRFEKEAKDLKVLIQSQFYDSKDGWFYDTNLKGDTFIKGEGSEGWTALWAKAASQEQAAVVKEKMMSPEKFYTKVPFQTMSADHKKFNPLKGYWRGPNWLDQSYFGVKGLRNYGFNEDADKATIQILKGAEGVLGKGKSIRENYHPLTGEGLNAQNFSWSAAHIIMLLMKN